MFNPLLALPPGQHNMEMPWHDTMQELGMKGQQPDINSVLSIPASVSLLRKLMKTT